ncbi:hypothetical protein [uncultured Apibacter sp.]|uniref:hypothetical protein n=1 Tax=uncultured Apibacter sp. TaxID=1778616 RepID=UPI0025FF0D8A|nr:hypothetical protein [uncultured Apibacter sp.]
MIYNNKKTLLGKYYYGRTPMQTFINSKDIAKEKRLKKNNATTYSSLWKSRSS